MSWWTIEESALLLLNVDCTLLSAPAYFRLRSIYLHSVRLIQAIESPVCVRAKVANLLCDQFHYLAITQAQQNPPLLVSMPLSMSIDLGKASKLPSSAGEIGALHSSSPSLPLK